ncbi:MAG: flavocytochrome c [Alkalibacterium sp.]|nr:flavocytochrome c [Alkalibacterium sp.]
MTLLFFCKKIYRCSMRTLLSTLHLYKQSNGGDQVTSQPFDLMNDYDVIIVGAGGAGLSAAITAKDSGAHPVIFEKMPTVRGNTIKSSAGMNASETKFQKKQGINDSNGRFYEETLAGGNGSNDSELLRYFVEHSADAINWLDSLDISLSNLTTTGGMSLKRTHRPSDGSAIGGYLVKGLKKNVEKRDIPVVVNADVKNLVIENGVIGGVRVVIEDGRERVIKAKTVIVTTGGFGSNRSMLSEVSPGLDRFITTNDEGSMGEGIHMIQDVGGAVRDLNHVQVHPTVHQESGFLMTEAIRGEGAILISASGCRFVNELDRRDVVSKAIMDTSEEFSFLVFDANVKTRVPAIGFYQSKGMVYESQTISELSKVLNIDCSVFNNTLNKWNQAVKSKTDIEFHRSTGMDHRLSRAPFFAIKVAPGVHHTMGGVIINTKAEVQSSKGVSIKGLYAAGETVGGLHGENRIGGNAIAETVVFGRQAGKQAAMFIRASQTAHNLPQK